jgi:hypothetical protein
METTTWQAIAALLLFSKICGRDGRGSTASHAGKRLPRKRVEE